MRKMTCQDCGKQYDYDKDDFCPKCGSYNKPASAAGTKLERDLLTRFRDGREGQKRVTAPRPQGGSPSPHRPDGVQNSRFPQAQFKPHSMGAAVEGRGRHRDTIGACDERPTKNRSGLFLLLIIGLVLLVNFFPLIVNALLNVTPQTGTSEWVVSGGTAGESKIIPHTVGDTFLYNDVSVCLPELWWLDLSSMPNYEQEGKRALAVSLYITGGERRDDLYIADPVLECSNGTRLPLEQSQEFSHALQKTSNIYHITLSDYQWESPLYGQLVFFVPDGETEPALVLEEYAPGNVKTPVLVSTHRIPLPLP